MNNQEKSDLLKALTKFKEGYAELNSLWRDNDNVAEFMNKQDNEYLSMSFDDYCLDVWADEITNDLINLKDTFKPLKGE